MVEVPRIVDWTKVADSRSRTYCKLVHVQFANNDCPGLFQFPDHVRIFSGNTFGEYGTRGCSPDTCSINIIFDSDRYPVKVASPVGIGDLRLGPSGFGESLLRQDGYEGV
jgi:hypothetical protein